jgi:hypothetical protein
VSLCWDQYYGGNNGQLYEVVIDGITENTKQKPDSPQQETQCCIASDSDPAKLLLFSTADSPEHAEWLS